MKKNLTTQVLIITLGLVALVSCNVLPDMKVATPMLTSSHKIVSNDLPWHEVWRKVIGPSYSKGVSWSFPLAACNDGAIAMPVWSEREIRLVVLNAGDGNTIWSQQLFVPKPAIPTTPVGGQVDREPASRVDTVAMDSEQVYVALPNAIESFGLKDGRERWISYDGLTGHTGYYIFPLDESRLLQIYGISATQARVFYIDKQDGRTQSVQNYTTEILQDAANGKYLNTPKGLVRVDKNTDQVLWSVSMPGPVRKWPIFAPSGVMLASSGTLVGTLFGIDPKSGNILWKTPEYIASSYTLINDSVYSLDENARLIARDVATGSESGRIVFDGSPLDVNHASEYWVIGGACGLFIYFGDSHELVAFKTN